MKRFGLVCAVLGVCVADELQAALDTRFSVENATVMGSFRLPTLLPGQNLPKRCFEFDSDLCQRETEAHYDAVFPVYEQRYQVCGMAGWKKLGVLGAGHVSEVELRKTPCGMEVAMKASPLDDHQQDYAYDCSILKMLMAYQNDPRCNGCFPKFIYYSNSSTVCYAERVISVPIRVFLDHINANSTAGFQHVRKAFVEGLGALSVLQEAGVKHRDLTFRNILIRLPSKTSREYKVVFVDFGASWSSMFGSRPISNEMSSLGFHDLHSYACSFVKYFYPIHGFCGSKLRRPIPVFGQPGSFERFLTDVVRISQQRVFEPDYPSVISNFTSVISL
jgi:hypothetical protein